MSVASVPRPPSETSIALSRRPSPKQASDAILRPLTHSDRPNTATAHPLRQTALRPLTHSDRQHCDHSPTPTDNTATTHPLRQTTLRPLTHSDRQHCDRSPTPTDRTLRPFTHSDRPNSFPTAASKDIRSACAASAHFRAGVARCQSAYSDGSLGLQKVTGPERNNCCLYIGQKIRVSHRHWGHFTNCCSAGSDFMHSSEPLGSICCPPRVRTLPSTCCGG